MTLSISQARRLGFEKKNKYNSEKTEKDNIIFASQKEAAKYEELALLLKAGQITKLELQPVYVLQQGFTDNSGRRHRAIKYKADFRITYPDGTIAVIDTKGYRTPAYMIKKKLLLKRYPDIVFIEE